MEEVTNFPKMATLKSWDFRLSAVCDRATFFTGFSHEIEFETKSAQAKSLSALRGLTAYSIGIPTNIHVLQLKIAISRGLGQPFGVRASPTEEVRYLNLGYHRGYQH